MFAKLKFIYENIKDNFTGNNPDMEVETDAAFFDIDETFSAVSENSSSKN